MQDRQRTNMLGQALREARLDGLICALPKNVLLFSGYWPVVGTSVAVAFADGSVRLIVPEDERELAQSGHAQTVVTFKPGSLDKITTASEELVEPLRGVASSLGQAARVGIETGEDSEPVSYAAMHLYGSSLAHAAQTAFPNVQLAPADDCLSSLRSVKTQAEVGHTRTSCRMAHRAFGEAARQIRSGLAEIDAAALLESPIATSLTDFPDVRRTRAFVFVMSGPNSALASGAYARSRTRVMEQGDLVLVHCNACANGYWTDITRTFTIGKADQRKLSMYTAIFEARDAAFKTIAPGRKASEVDRAARHVLEKHGFGAEFKHSTGHGIGFGAISASARPRLHPKSPDVLESGMLFNVEPAIYFEGYGGMRHCDMVAVTDGGFELLTSFQNTIENLVLA